MGSLYVAIQQQRAVPIVVEESLRVGAHHGLPEYTVHYWARSAVLQVEVQVPQAPQPGTPPQEVQGGLRVLFQPKNLIVKCVPIFGLGRPQPYLPIGRLVPDVPVLILLWFGRPGLCTL